MGLEIGILEFMMKHAKEGGLVFVIAVLLVCWGLEIARCRGKDKIIAAKDKQNIEFQAQMLVLVGELKTSSSNNLLLLEMLVRGRK